MSSPIIKHALFFPLYFQTDAVQELALQWKNRLLQLKVLNASTKAALVSVHEWQHGSVPDVIFNEVIYTDVNYGYKDF